jgi:hypothetical protein
MAKMVLQFSSAATLWNFLQLEGIGPWDGTGEKLELAVGNEVDWWEVGGGGGVKSGVDVDHPRSVSPAPRILMQIQ